MFTLPLGQCVATRRRVDSASLALGAAILGLGALVSGMPFRATLPPAGVAAPAAHVITLQSTGAPLASLRDEAEAMRARLLAMPGVGAVQLHGLLTTGLEVEYSQAGLARGGVTQAELRAALPAQAHEVAPGRIAMPLDSLEAGPQSVADRIVRSGGRSVRLGDIATVARVRMDPVSVMSRDGHPAVELVVVGAGG